MKLGLGTAQFGLSYGVTNVGGQVPAARAQTMIRCAFEQGIELFDTAPDYGTAEKVLGSVQLPGAAKIVTKIGRLGRNSFGPRAISQIRTRFRDSLARLHRPDVYGVLLHAPDDLRLPGADLLIEMLHDLRDRGMVRRVGISAYRREQIDYCLRRFSLDLFQVPVSYLDQRLVRSGLLGDILKSGAEIHARSAFLQGSLLVEPDALPGYFEPWRGKLASIRATLASCGVTPSAAALAFVRSRARADYVIVGVTTKQELQELLRDSSLPVPDLPFEQFAVDDEALIDPSRWPVFPTQICDDPWRTL